ncbi:hypothetical protein ABET51_20675, partial [Metabacillus fastidiosus]|uniref:hypothetical protein n=1 Tax=Metabacillus fastidiosus TaxID=1458 RepID=UPI003D2952CC
SMCSIFRQLIFHLTSPDFQNFEGGVLLPVKAGIKKKKRLIHFIFFQGFNYFSRLLELLDVLVTIERKVK